MSPSNQPPPQRGGQVVIGVDLGGTGTRVVALDSRGEVRAHQTVRTPRTASGPGVLAELIRAVAGDAAVAAVGIGASGPVDARGVIRNDDTLAAFSHIPLTGLLEAELGVPCAIENDAVAAAIGEATYGAAKDSADVLMVTLGTGVGVSVLLGGRPFRAADGTHPEAGHIPVPGAPAACYCGLATCWEQLASRTALDRLTQGRTAELAGIAGYDNDAAALFRQYGESVGFGTSALLTIFKPDRVVFGGGAAAYLPHFASGLDTALHRAGGFDVSTPYSEAALGDLSGAIGAAVLASDTTPAVTLTHTSKK
ncbi:ROK family protein [Amycolatopsis sp. NBC_01480]|uniref:ROK family protein n=1 Tax=Amycolatopsis sp. NBC_01480 TaxID=2903562 RepID=UPI002E2C5195|nr:ROK family protein [Amycolatopsis sp. NBC_01480]